MGPVKYFGIIGRKRSGKDTFADTQRRIHSAGSIETVAFADPLKESMAILFDVPLKHFYDDDLKEKQDKRWNMSPREMCMWMGTDILRNKVSADFLVQRAQSKVSKLTVKPSVTAIVFTDVRFPNELKLLRDLNAKLIYIDASERLGPLPPNSHASESEIETLGKKAHLTIGNDGARDEFIDLVKKIDILKL